MDNIQRNLTTAMELHRLRWLLIYGSKHGNIDFHSLFTVASQPWSILRFVSSLEHFLSDPLDTLSEAALIFEKIRKVFKSKVQGAVFP